MTVTSPTCHATASCMAEHPAQPSILAHSVLDKCSVLITRRKNTQEHPSDWLFLQPFAPSLALLSPAALYGASSRLVQPLRGKRSRQRTSFSSTTESDSRCWTKNHQSMTVLLRTTSTQTASHHAAFQRDSPSPGTLPLWFKHSSIVVV